MDGHKAVGRRRTAGSRKESRGVNPRPEGEEVMHHKKARQATLAIARLFSTCLTFREKGASEVGDYIPALLLPQEFLTFSETTALRNSLCAHYPVIINSIEIKLCQK